MPVEANLTGRERWEFDGEVTAAFDDMLRRSIPDHDDMRRLCHALASPHVQVGTEILDLGCSRGEAMAPFVHQFGATVRHIGVEISPPMLAAARERFAGLINCGVCEIRQHDLRRGFPPCRPSACLCVLTLQFVPIEHRQRLLRDAHRALLPGGCLVLVEKVLGATATIDAALCQEYWAFKESQGYTKDEIDRKRMALEGVLVPVTAAWNEELLRMAGFREVDCFWRRLNFAGWIALKD